jgi:hypothetical protein
VCGSTAFATLVLPGSGAGRTGGGYGRLKMLVNLTILRELELDLSSRLLSLINAVEPVESQTEKEMLKEFQDQKKAQDPVMPPAKLSPNGNHLESIRRTKTSSSGSRG